MMPVAPCKWCDHRVVEDPEKGTKDCHDRCEEYLSFRKALDDFNAEVNRIKREQKVTGNTVRNNSHLQRRWSRSGQRGEHG